MEKYIILLTLCSSLILCGCVTEYEAKGIDELADILVVDGIITDDETIITLSQSINLTETGGTYAIYVDHARVYVECDDGTQWEAEPPESTYYGILSRNGRYIIRMDQFNLDQKYRLKIEIDERDDDCMYDVQSGGFLCPTKTYEYCSDFSYPIRTSEIDSIFWFKSGRGQPVMIQIATHSLNEEVLYYRWSYKEDWEINSDLRLEPYPYYCWDFSNSSNLLIGSAEKTVFGRVTDILTEFPPSDRRLSVLYRIEVKQTAISKRAYNYFANIRRNAENIGSIFAPVPSELRGNITCITDPKRPAIGYIDVSSKTQKTLYISRRDNLYEPPSRGSICDIFSRDTLYQIYGSKTLMPPPGWADYLSGFLFVRVICVDCTNYGTTQRPDNWPNNH